MEGAYAAATSLYEEEAAKNAKFKAIYEPWTKFRAEEAQWFALAESAMDQFFAAKLKSLSRYSEARAGHAPAAQVCRRASTALSEWIGQWLKWLVLFSSLISAGNALVRYTLAHQLERLARDPVVHVRRHVPAGGGLCAQA